MGSRYELNILKGVNAPATWVVRLNAANVLKTALFKLAGLGAVDFNKANKLPTKLFTSVLEALNVNTVFSAHDVYIPKKSQIRGKGRMQRKIAWLIAEHNRTKNFDYTAEPDVI